MILKIAESSFTNDELAQYLLCLMELFIIQTSSNPILGIGHRFLLLSFEYSHHHLRFLVFVWSKPYLSAGILKSGLGNQDKNVEIRFSYALSGEDIENAILGGS